MQLIQEITSEELCTKTPRRQNLLREVIQRKLQLRLDICVDCRVSDNSKDHHQMMAFGDIDGNHRVGWQHCRLAHSWDTPNLHEREPNGDTLSTGVHSDHTVHVSTDLSLYLDSPMLWAPWHQNMSTYSQSYFSSSTWKRCKVWMCKL